MGSSVKLALDDKIFSYINYFLLALVLVVLLVPLLFVVNASFSDPEAVYGGKVLFYPVGFTMEGYQRIFKDNTIWTGYRNTVIYTAVGTVINVILVIAAAYPLSRRDFVGRNIFTFMIIFTMFFNGGMIPTYLLVKDLNMLNSLWAMVLPNAIGVWNVVIARTFFQNSIPQELNDAAQIDGCTNVRYLVHIVLPLSRPILAVIVLYCAVMHWNSFFAALIYLTEEKLYPLQLILRTILVQAEMAQDMLEDLQTQIEIQRVADLIRYGVIIVASLPMLILYPFLQKYFVKGVMIGSVKG